MRVRVHARSHVCIRLIRADVFARFFSNAREAREERARTFQEAWARARSCAVAVAAAPDVSCRCSVVTVTEHGIYRFFFVFTAFQWLQCSHKAIHSSRSTLGTVVIVVSTSKRLVFEAAAKYGSVSSILFCDSPSENAVTRVPLSLFSSLRFWVEPGPFVSLVFLAGASRRVAPRPRSSSLETFLR